MNYNFFVRIFSMKKVINLHLSCKRVKMSPVLFFVISFLFPFSAQADNTSNILDELDGVISQKAVFHKAIQTKIDSLVSLANIADEDELYRLYCEIYDCYNNYQVDSALMYIHKIEELPFTKADPELYKSVMMKKAITYALMGDFVMAIELLDNIDVKSASNSLRCEYFHSCRTIYGWYSEYINDGKHRNRRYSDLTQMYRDSILVHSEPGIRRNNVLADNYILQGNIGKAMDLLYDIINQAVDEQKVYAYYNLAQCYRIKGDDDKYAMYLALTAMSDIRNGITEYVALMELSGLMLRMGDVDRAYNYLFCSMEDAHFCGSFLRTFEVNTIFPIIDKEYREQEKRSQKFEHMMLTVVSVVSVILVFLLFYLQKQMARVRTIKEKLSQANKRLAVANNQLEDANQQLEDANSQLQGYNSKLGENNDMLSKANDLLQNTNKVKEEYIAHYLEMCRSYMDSFEDFRKNLLRLAKGNQHQEVMSLLKSGDVMEEEQKRFYADFDKSFLNIHPNFIGEFNALLKEDYQLIPKKGELLNIELRIFALIRLGVDDSAMIAHFLNYSLPTIYNYRSRIRNNSIYSKEEFNRRIMEIS